MITLIGNQGYIHNIRVNSILKILSEVERVNIYNINEKNFFFKAYRKIVRKLGLYDVINKVIIANKLKDRKKKPLLLSFSYDFCEIYKGEVILDIDDPNFSTKELEIINLPKVKALVVTTTYIEEIYRVEYNVYKPIYVIPTPLDVGKSSKNKNKEKFIVGYFSSFINEQELEQIVEIADKLTIYKEIEIWVIGKKATEIDRNNIRYFGYLEHDEMLKLVQEFNIGLYVRSNDLRGRLSVKLIEMMSMGIPIVSTDVSEAFCVIEGKAGYVVPKIELPLAVEKMYKDQEFQEKCSKRAKSYSEKFEGDIVAENYRNLLKTYNI